MKGQMRQGLFPFLVLQTEECGLHLICGDAGLNLHPSHQAVDKSVSQKE